MASYTPNYNLKKPADADTYDIADANGNMDLIDTALHSQNEAIANSFKYVTSGSLHDIKGPGVYSIASAVTDKPSANGGTYVVSNYSNGALVGGTYIDVVTGDTYAVNLYSGTWKYEKLALNSKLTNKTTWSFIHEITTTADVNFDQIVSVTIPTDITELMFTLQRASNGRTFASSVVPWTQFKGGALYASGQYSLYSGTYTNIVNTGHRLINAVVIYQSDSTIEIAINANDEAIKARIFAR